MISRLFALVFAAFVFDVCIFGTFIVKNKIANIIAVADSACARPADCRNASVYDIVAFAKNRGQFAYFVLRKNIGIKAAAAIPFERAAVVLFPCKIPAARTESRFLR